MPIIDGINLKLLKLIDAESGATGMDFGRTADQAEALYGSSESNPRTTKKMLGIDRGDRDLHLEYLTEKGLISSLRLLGGDWTSVKLTSEGHDYIRESQIGKKVWKILPPFMEKFVWPVLVGAVLMVIAIFLGIKS